MHHREGNSMGSEADEVWLQSVYCTDTPSEKGGLLPVPAAVTENVAFEVGGLLKCIQTRPIIRSVWLTDSE